jgi:hypothetical protein
LFQKITKSAGRLPFKNNIKKQDSPLAHHSKFNLIISNFVSQFGLGEKINKLRKTLKINVHFSHTIMDRCGVNGWKEGNDCELGRKLRICSSII